MPARRPALAAWRRTRWGPRRTAWDGPARSPRKPWWARVDRDRARSRRRRGTGSTARCPGRRRKTAWRPRTCGPAARSRARVGRTLRSRRAYRGASERPPWGSPWCRTCTAKRRRRPSSSGPARARGSRLRPARQRRADRPAALADDRELASPALLDMAIDEPMGGVQLARDHGADITSQIHGVKLAGRPAPGYVAYGAAP